MDEGISVLVPEFFSPLGEDRCWAPHPSSRNSSSQCLGKDSTSAFQKELVSTWKPQCALASGKNNLEQMSLENPDKQEWHQRHLSTGSSSRQSWNCWVPVKLGIASSESGSVSYLASRGL